MIGGRVCGGSNGGNVCIGTSGGIVGIIIGGSVWTTGEVVVSPTVGSGVETVVDDSVELQLSPEVVVEVETGDTVVIGSSSSSSLPNPLGLLSINLTLALRPLPYILSLAVIIMTALGPSDFITFPGVMSVPQNILPS